MIENYFKIMLFLSFSVVLGDIESCNGKNVILTDPARAVNYPKNRFEDVFKKYDGNMTCKWTIILPTGVRIYLSFQNLNLEISDGCRDFVEVQEPDGLSYGTYCYRIFDDLYSKSNILNITFKTDPTLKRYFANGFTFKYESLYKSNKILGQECSTNFDCNNALGLECKNSICVCKPGYFPDFSTLDCYAYPDTSCGTFNFLIKCSSNAICDKNHICKCEPGFSQNALKNGCVVSKKFGDTCSYDSDCDRDLGIICQENICQCPFKSMQNLNLHNDTKLCPGLAGSRCRNGTCSGKNIFCSDVEICECRENYRKGRFECLKDFGRDCNTTKKCHEDYICTRGKCFCKKDQLADFNSKNIFECRTNVNASCDSSLRCQHNAKCTVDKENNNFNRCQCHDGFIFNDRQKCVPGYKMPCTEEIKNRCSIGLDCRKGICFCALDTWVFDHKAKKCLVKFNNPCKEEEDCFGNLQCGLSRSIEDPLSIYNIKTCQCFNGTFNQVNKTCIPGNFYIPDTIGSSDNLQWLFILIGTILGFTTITFLTISVICIRRNSKFKKLLSRNEFIEFYEGRRGSNQKPDEKDYESLSFNDKHEIPVDDLEIDENCLLGSGQQGKIFKGNLKTKNTDKSDSNIFGTVAVKTTKETQDKNLMLSQLSEIKIVLALGSHSNIVEFFGAQTKDIQKGTLYIVFEFCELGSLDHYLKKYRDNFNKTDENLNMTLLIQWSNQVANGMKHLEIKNVIHSDLAARNVLLTSEKIAKITDFGLSRKLYSDIYLKQTREALPWRWMAPECMRDLMFSSKSDVWSFGVFLWEIFSLGAVPYPGDTLTIDFVERIANELRPNKPLHATDQIYNQINADILGTGT